MIEQIQFSLALLVILGLALLALFYFISTRTPNRFLWIVAPAVIILLGISTQMNYDAGNVFATSALAAAPVAVFIAPVLFPGFVGQKTGIKRMVACYLIVSLFAAGFAFYFVMSDFSMVPWIHSQTPVLNGIVCFVESAADLLLAAGIYEGIERTRVLAVW